MLRPAAFRHPIGLAREALGAGRLDEAESRIRAVLNDRPEHPDALHLLGIIALHCGRERPAAELLARAVEIDPKHAAIHSDLGNALHACGQLDQALRAFSTATRLAPDVALWHFNLGNALNVKGRPDPRYTCVRDPRVKVIEPVEGMVLLFPSYLWHRTVPLDSAEERISIAFDVYPEAWPTG